MTLPTMRRFSRVMAHVTLVAALLLPLLAGLGWVYLDVLAELAVGEPGFGFDAATVGAPARWAGFAVSLGGAALQAFGLLGLRKTFVEAAEGRWLSRKAIVGFRRFAWISVAMVLVGIVQKSAHSVLLTMGHPTRPGQLVVGFGSNEIKALFIGLLLVFAAQLFTIGRQAEEENAAFL